ncbi:hypothetical protein [Bacillus cereus group sp. FL70]|uniref:hypothetical protein n=1 Tax=Bacillus cereus group sp. FL70 TaxID=3040254 RepID=UPI003395B91D
MTIEIDVMIAVLLLGISHFGKADGKQVAEVKGELGYIPIDLKLSKETVKLGW